MNRGKYHNIHEKYQELFQGTPITVRSPGRINLIGEHTDYNLGFVLPAAIDKEMLFCMGLNSGTTCNLYALDIQEQFSFDLESLQHSPLNWANYLIGVVDQCKRSGCQLEGFNCVFGGDIPVGAGMSSSAALMCGLAYGLGVLNHLELSRLEIAKLGQAAENDFVGLECGLMDQYANMFGREHHLVLMDCRSETHETVKIDLKDFGLWLFNSNVSHELSSSEYNVRRKECEQGIKAIQKIYPEVQSLRDSDSTMLSCIDDPMVRQRCEYVMEENLRVINGSQDLRSGNLEAFGEKMYESHYGLSRKYQVSCPELDLLVNLTENENSIAGARMMGGGFGGCTINMIRISDAPALIDRISQRYLDETGKKMAVYPVRTANGTSVLKYELPT